MPAFCTSCGAPLTGPFCTKCGSGAQAVSRPSDWPVQSQPVPSQPLTRPTAQTAPEPAVAGTKIKILVIAGCVLLSFVLLGAAGAIYGVYWVKHKVAGYTSAVSGGSSEAVKVVERDNSCRLLSTAELAQVVGVAIEKSAEIVEGSVPGCAYYTNPQAFAQLQRMAIEQARRQSEQAAKQPGATDKKDDFLGLLKNANQMEGVVKSFGLGQPDKDGRVFSFTVQRDFGRGNWNTVRAALSLVPGFEDITGVGDRAMMGSFGHTIQVLKGDSAVSLELTFVPDARNRGAEIARVIISRL
jgi:hypothetical protein